MKTKEQARANLEASVAYIPVRYEQGIRAADWATAAGSDAAEKLYAEAIAAAIARKSRQLGIKKVSNADWQDRAVTKGAPVIGTRIMDAIPKQAAKWGPMYDQVVSRVKTLVPKTIDFRSNVTNRVLPVVEAWKKAAGKL